MLVPCLGVAPGVSYSSSSGRYLARSSVEVHGSCDDRIGLYPAAPFRLATLLHAWTYRAGGMGLIARTADWLDHSAKRFLSHTSDLPNAPEGASELFASARRLGCRQLKNGALRNEPELDIAPCRDCQLTCDRNNHDPFDAPALTLCPLQEPSRQRALRLMLGP